MILGFQKLRCKLFTISGSGMYFLLHAKFKCLNVQWQEVLISFSHKQKTNMAKDV